MIADLVKPVRDFWARVDRSRMEHELEQRAVGLAPRRSLANSIRSRDAVSYIFEIKRSSPSRGMLNPTIDPVAVAEIYQRYGAAGVSVLTEASQFGGSLDDLRLASGSVSIPVLRKDFVIDEMQILESRAYGADAILLMVKLLGTATRRFVEACESYDIEPLVEIHNLQELGIAVESGAMLIGINNRDLDNLSIDLTTTERLASSVPADRIVVAESGIESRADVLRMQRAGARAVLIGSALSTACSLEQKLEDLTGCKQN